MNPMPKLLSKTKLLRGFRCAKSIYLTIHHPEYETPLTSETQALFDQGNAVGAKAREYYPGGILIDSKPWEFTAALIKTRQLLSNGATLLYEAAFEYLGFCARIDILQLSPETKRWRILEVKSTTKVKPEHYDDAGIQAWILSKNDFPIEQVNIVHLNPACRYPDLHNLFVEVDVTEAIRDRYLTIQPKVRDIFTTLQQPSIPEVDIGPYCLEPTECGFKAYCWQKKDIPAMSIFNLPGMKDKKWSLYQAGITSLDDDRLTDLNELQTRIVTCFKQNERIVNKAIIRQALSHWQFPLVFLDFETINPALPRYSGCKPYDQVPFQFSVHRLNALNDSLSHSAYLHDQGTDPRIDLIPALLNACGERGSIVAYHAKFETARIKELAEFSPKHQDALLKLIDRFVDPLPLIRESIYDNAFLGSFSLKKVSPALLGEGHDYNNMLVANGNDAQRAYEKLISPHTPAVMKDTLRDAMLTYCKKDTLEMVELVKWLYNLI